MVAYLVHDGEDFDPKLDSVPFVEVDWARSTSETILFRDGFRLISTTKGPGRGFHKPRFLFFSVCVLNVLPETFVIKSIGFSLLPLNVSAIGSLQGYFQLPIYNDPFDVKDLFSLVDKEPWGLVESLNLPKSKVKVFNSSLLVRLHLKNFEVGAPHSRAGSTTSSPSTG